MSLMNDKCLSSPYSATALVLAGGTSNRMGINKAFVPIQGTMLIERVLFQLEPLFSEILLCVSGKKPCEFLNISQVVDDQPFQGPLRAILSGLRASNSSINFAVACDIPDINQEFLEQMFSFTKSSDIVVPLTGQGKYEPLFAFYNKKIIPVIENLLDKGQRKLSLLFSRCLTRYVWMNDKSWYFNLNTLDDLKKYEHRAARKMEMHNLTGLR